MTAISKTAKPRTYPAIISAAEIEPLEVNWLWRPYIPRGMITLIEGDPGLGKSWLTMAIASAISKGERLPGQSHDMAPQKVLILNAEDSYEHTIAPRLIALEANLQNINLAPRFFPLDKEGVQELTHYMRESAATIVFIDPLVAYLGSKVDMHRANEVRGVMASLMTAAADSETAMVCVRHLRKGQGGSSKTIYEGIGSIDFTASARSVLLVHQAKDGTNMISHIKSNVAKKGPSLTYTLSEYDVVDKYGNATTASRFQWGGIYEGEEAPKGTISHIPKQQGRAEAFLKQMLADGPRKAVDMLHGAAQNGISEKTLKRAKRGLVESIKMEEEWYWALIRGEELEQTPGFLDPAVLEEARKRLEQATSP